MVTKGLLESNDKSARRNGFAGTKLLLAFGFTLIEALTTGCTGGITVSVTKPKMGNASIDPRQEGLCRVARLEVQKPVVAVMTKARCTTEQGVWVFVDTDVGRISDKKNDLRLTPWAWNTVESAALEKVNPGDEITVTVWTKCEDGDVIQGAGSCRIP